MGRVHSGAHRAVDLARGAGVLTEGYEAEARGEKSPDRWRLPEEARVSPAFLPRRGRRQGLHRGLILVECGQLLTRRFISLFWILRGLVGALMRGSLSGSVIPRPQRRRGGCTVSAWPAAVKPLAMQVILEPLSASALLILGQAGGSRARTSHPAASRRAHSRSASPWYVDCFSRRVSAALVAPHAGVRGNKPKARN